MAEEQFCLNEAAMERLEQEARKAGVTPEVMASLLAKGELIRRTTPKAKGKVTPFRGRP
jgi:ribosomal protein L22